MRAPPRPPAMDDEQLLRYSRHLLLPEIDIDGQEKWRQARILIIGAGGLGSAAGAYLAASGVGTLVLCDDDRVELSNLQRQILHNTERIGRLKVESARDTLAALNPDVNIHTHAARLSADALLEEARRADLILDCSDNFATRHAINRASRAARTPLVSGAVIGFSGQLAVFDPRQPNAPCYHCLFPEAADACTGTCSENGVFAPLVGIIGAWQAAEALKLLAGLPTLTATLLLLDARTAHTRRLTIPRDPACPVCCAPA